MSKGRIFITGASGYVGSVITQQAISQGYTVHGLARSEAGVEKLKALGAIPIRGELSSIDLLRHESSQADAVFHLAFIHDWSRDYNEILRIDAAAVDAMAAGLKGTDKPFVITSGTGIVTPDPEGRETTEEDAADGSNPLGITRHKSEKHALDLAKDGVRVIAIRLPPYVYGRGGSGFIPWLMKQAVDHKEALYVGEGSVRTSGVYVDDAAALYLLAMDKTKAGEIFNATAPTYPTVKEMAEAIGAVLGVPARSTTREEVEKKWGEFLAAFVNRPNMASNQKAREQLGFQPKGIEMIEDIRTGSYVALAKTLNDGGKTKYA